MWIIKHINMSGDKLYVDLRVSLEVNNYELAQNLLQCSISDGFNVIAFSKDITLGDRVP